MDLAASTVLSFSRFSFAPSPSRAIPFSIRRRKSSFITRNATDAPGDDADDEDGEQKNRTRLLQVSVTLTVIASSLAPQRAHAKVAEKKPRSKRPAEALSPEEHISWSRGLPTVGDRIPYTDILSLREEGKLRHIVKVPSVSLRQQPDPVLVVLDDSRVLRKVLPPVERDGGFWESWDQLKLDS